MRLSEQMKEFGWTIREIMNHDEKLGVRDFEIITHDNTQYQCYTDSNGVLHWWSVLNSKEIDQSLIMKKFHEEQQYVNAFESYCIDKIHVPLLHTDRTTKKHYLEPGQYIQCGNFVYGVVGKVYDCKLYLGREYFGNIKYCLTVDAIQNEIIRIWARWGECVGQHILLELMNNPYHIENIRLFEYRKAVMHYYRIFEPYRGRRMDFSLLLSAVQQYADKIDYELPDMLFVPLDEHMERDELTEIFNLCEGCITAMCWTI